MTENERSYRAFLDKQLSSFQVAGHVLTQTFSLGFVQHLGEERAHLCNGSEREIL